MHEPIARLSTGSMVAPAGVAALLITALVACRPDAAPPPSPSPGVSLTETIAPGSPLPTLDESACADIAAHTTGPPQVLLSDGRVRVPGTRGSFSWGAADVTSAASLVAGSIRPGVWTPRGAPLVIQIAQGPCLITSAAVRLYDPEAARTPEEIMRSEFEAGSDRLEIDAPKADSLVEAYLTFGSVGSAAYYWQIQVAG